MDVKFGVEVRFLPLSRNGWPNEIYWVTRYKSDLKESEVNHKLSKY